MEASLEELAGLCHVRQRCSWWLQLRGCGMSADAHHITQPPEDGRGAARAMTRALENAGAAPAQVSYINAHGTGTPLGDVAELRAIQSTFGASGPAQEQAQKPKVHVSPEFIVDSTQGLRNMRQHAKISRCAPLRLHSLALWHQAARVACLWEGRKHLLQ